MKVLAASTHENVDGLHNGHHRALCVRKAELDVGLNPQQTSLSHSPCLLDEARRILKKKRKRTQRGLMVLATSIISLPRLSLSRRRSCVSV